MTTTKKINLNLTETEYAELMVTIMSEKERLEKGILKSKANSSIAQMVYERIDTLKALLLKLK